MHHRTWSTAHPQRQVRIVVGAVVVLAMAAAVVYGFLATRSNAPGRPASVTATAMAHPPTPVTVTTPTVPAATELAPIAGTADPVAFATAVARALFDWETTGPHPLADHKGRLLAIADPNGVESPGLVADLGAYLPSAQAWDFLTEYDTRQWIEITDAAVPGQWPAVVAAAGDALAPGTTAVTVTGVRHRAGLWEGREVTERFDVAFTAVAVCGPTYPQCYLLRLSRLDEPLR
ncbi:hypothetical protein [Georgenia yuyongxinii]